MTCDEYKESISLLLDAELENRNQRQLFKHLSECNDCQQFLDSVITLREIRAKENLPFPLEIDEALFARLHLVHPVRARHPLREKSTPFFHRHFMIPAPVAIALGILIIAAGIFFGVFTRQQEGNSSWFTTAGLLHGKQQPTVIFIYGIPEVHVIDSTPVKVKEIRNQTIF